MGPPETEGAGGQVPPVLFYYLFIFGWIFVAAHELSPL